MLRSLYTDYPNATKIVLYALGALLVAALVTLAPLAFGAEVGRDYVSAPPREPSVNGDFMRDALYRSSADRLELIASIGTPQACAVTMMVDGRASQSVVCRWQPLDIAERPIVVIHTGNGAFVATLIGTYALIPAVIVDVHNLDDGPQPVSLLIEVFHPTR